MPSLDDARFRAFFTLETTTDRTFPTNGVNFIGHRTTMHPDDLITLRPDQIWIRPILFFRVLTIKPDDLHVAIKHHDTVRDRLQKAPELLGYLLQVAQRPS